MLIRQMPLIRKPRESRARFGKVTVAAAAHLFDIELIINLITSKFSLGIIEYLVTSIITRYVGRNKSTSKIPINSLILISFTDW